MNEKQHCPSVSLAKCGNYHCKLCVPFWIGNLLDSAASLYLLMHWHAGQSTRAWACPTHGWHVHIQHANKKKINCRWCHQRWAQLSPMRPRSPPLKKNGALLSRRNVFTRLSLFIYFFFTVFFGVGGWVNQMCGMDCIFNFIPWQCLWSQKTNK